MHIPPSMALLPACTIPLPIQLCVMAPAAARHHSLSFPLKDPLQAFSPPRTEAKLLDRGVSSVPAACRWSRGGRAARRGEAGEGSRRCEGNFPRLPQGFVSGLPALHDPPASELLGASSTPPGILPAQLPNSALPASPGNLGNGHHRNISAHSTGSPGAQTWRERQTEIPRLSVSVLPARAAGHHSAPGSSLQRIPHLQSLSAFAAGADAALRSPSLEKAV